MLTLYRRHSADCPHSSDPYWKKCRCPMWVRGVLEGRAIKQTVQCRSWDKAAATIREWEEDQAVPEEKPRISPSRAKVAFLAELKTRKVSAASIRKFELLLGSLEKWCARDGIEDMKDLDVPQVRAFRNEWTWGPLTSAKYLERTRQFFKFSVQNKWMSENPALFLKTPKIPPTQVAPFEPEELAKIIAEAEKNPRHLALVLLLRHSGLRIADAVCLKRNRIKDGKLFLYPAETGQPVWLPLPDVVNEALEKCPNRSREYFFWTGVSKKQTVVNDWRDDLARLFKRAGVSTGHPHRFRHTLAARLLEQGVPISEVAVILGNSARIVEKHYAGWNLARQRKLEELVKTTWETKRQLVRVK